MRNAVKYAPFAHFLIVFWGCSNPSVVFANSSLCTRELLAYIISVTEDIVSFYVLAGCGRGVWCAPPLLQIGLTCRSSAFPGPRSSS